MNLLCRLFGHQPPRYGKKGWWSPGEEYADRVTAPCVDGIGRRHSFVVATCPRCGVEYNLCRIHWPQTVINPPIASIKERDHVIVKNDNGTVTEFVLLAD